MQPTKARHSGPNTHTQGATPIVQGSPQTFKGECNLKTIMDVVNDLDTMESYLVLIRNALVCQDPAKGGYIGSKGWEDIFTDLCDRLQDSREALENIKRGQDA